MCQDPVSYEQARRQLAEFERLFAGFCQAAQECIKGFQQQELMAAKQGKAVVSIDRKVGVLREYLGARSSGNGVITKEVKQVEEDLSNETGQIKYGSTDLSKVVINYRRTNNIYTARNVAVFEYVQDRELKILAMASKRGVGHAERLVAKELANMGVSTNQVTRIYSELEPCSVPGGYCKRFLQNTFPEAVVTYSFEYGDKDSRTRGIEALKNAINKLLD
ncbi:nucleic acid/nucleotide deaminase domain-containing protein [Hazenella coriacea]|uniref:Nucleic acid/nucleotide deaminase of polymorphic system toxin n=1 Tax=Hazenella coriacea TaxID=1179467 RepID=A0A4R3L527_9BACL|nr:nucleic acid/nucleotide deaminase domain-containing protein [Hazenella coriacea]TCS93244.1 nucleic acid/nucleotide deaminase of polymorphic system toxin [Hazenella coriacea]